MEEILGTTKILDGKTMFLSNEYLHLSLVNGYIAYNSGFLYNMRFYGNYETGYTEDTREYSKDMPKDGDEIWFIVRLLFPSTGVTFTTVSTNKQNFASNLADISDIAKLINFSTLIREGVKIVNQLEHQKADFAKEKDFDKVTELSTQLRSLRKDIQDKRNNLIKYFQDRAIPELYRVEEMIKIIHSLFNILTKKEKPKNVTVIRRVWSNRYSLDLSS